MITRHYGPPDIFYISEESIESEIDCNRKPLLQLMKFLNHRFSYPDNRFYCVHEYLAPTGIITNRFY